MAIVGSGISGLASAYFLQPHFDVVVYEKNNYVGGHSNTVTIEEGDRQVPIDTGFMVYNEITYPNLSRFFRQLAVGSKPTDMSFSVQHGPSGIQWSGTGFNRLFGERKNLLDRRFWRMLIALDRFNREATVALNNQALSTLSIAEYVERNGYGRDLLDLYLIPMSSALWSTAPTRIEEFPAVSLLRFFQNHGLLGMHSQHPWLTLNGGATTYVQAVVNKLNLKVLTNQTVNSVQRTAAGIELSTEDGQIAPFDYCVLACHADQALSLIAQCTGLERDVLRAFSYQRNPTCLHRDSKMMPRHKRNWAAWNHRTEGKHIDNVDVTTHYWMNKLQGVSKKVNYFVSLNANKILNQELLCREFAYEHPVFTRESLRAQERLPLLNKQSADQRLFFCGSYFKYGFHEDAFTSALEMSRLMAGEPIWQ